MTTSIVWFRRDLRLGDNPAWALGTRSDVVVPLFVIDPRPFDAVSASAGGCLSSSNSRTNWSTLRGRWVHSNWTLSGSGSVPRTRNR